MHFKGLCSRVRRGTSWNFVRLSLSLDVWPWSGVSLDVLKVFLDFQFVRFRCFEFKFRQIIFNLQIRFIRWELLWRTVEKFKFRLLYKPCQRSLLRPLLRCHDAVHFVLCFDCRKSIREIIHEAAVRTTIRFARSSYLRNQGQPDQDHLASPFMPSEPAVLGVVRDLCLASRRNALKPYNQTVQYRPVKFHAWASREAPQRS